MPADVDCRHSERHRGALPFLADTCRRDHAVPDGNVARHFLGAVGVDRGPQDIGKSPDLVNRQTVGPYRLLPQGRQGHRQKADLKGSSDDQEPPSR